MDQLIKFQTVSEHFGLTLTTDDVQALACRRQEALKATGRIEFGEGILPALIFRFCDSPHIAPEKWFETLAELQDLFYTLLSECGGALSDDELIDGMARLFNGPCEGSLCALADRSFEDFGEMGTDPPLEVPSW